MRELPLAAPPAYRSERRPPSCSLQSQLIQPTCGWLPPLPRPTAGLCSGSRTQLLGHGAPRASLSVPEPISVLLGVFCCFSLACSPLGPSPAGNHPEGGGPAVHLLGLGSWLHSGPRPNDLASEQLTVPRHKQAGDQAHHFGQQIPGVLPANVNPQVPCGHFYHLQCTEELGSREGQRLTRGHTARKGHPAWFQEEDGASTPAGGGWGGEAPVRSLGLAPRLQKRLPPRQAGRSLFQGWLLSVTPSEGSLLSPLPLSRPSAKSSLCSSAHTASKWEERWGQQASWVPGTPKLSTSPATVALGPRGCPVHPMCPANPWGRGY